MKTRQSVACGMFAVWLLVSLTTLAQTEAEKERAELAKALGAAKVSLQQGLAASEGQGKPISGKFELEHGQLQLSVYTAKNGKFSEVIVNHDTGTMAKAEDITSGDDLKAAKEQATAMARAKRALGAAVEKAAKANSGFKAVSVYPGLKEG